MISEPLREYLQSWLDWATGDAVDGEPYWRRRGLCTNAPWMVLGELNILLKDDEYPFGLDEYIHRSRAGTQHLDPNRLAWVREMLSDG